MRSTRCGLLSLLQRGLLVTNVSCAKPAESIEMSFGAQTREIRGVGTRRYTGACTPPHMNEGVQTLYPHTQPYPSSELHWKCCRNAENLKKCILKWTPIISALAWKPTNLKPSNLQRIACLRHPNPKKITFWNFAKFSFFCGFRTQSLDHKFTNEGDLSAYSHPQLNSWSEFCKYAYLLYG